MVNGEELRQVVQCVEAVVTLHGLLHPVQPLHKVAVQVRDSFAVVIPVALRHSCFSASLDRPRAVGYCLAATGEGVRVGGVRPGVEHAAPSPNASRFRRPVP